MVFIFLDDERVPSDVTWIKLPRTTPVIVRTLSDFQAAVIENLQNPDVDLVTISFDHDLQLFVNDREIKGQDCMWWLINYITDHHISVNRINCLFHSKNPIGLDNMKSLWTNFLKQCG